MVDDNTVLMCVRNETSPISLIHRDAERLHACIMQVRSRHLLSAGGGSHEPSTSGIEAATTSPTSSRGKLRAKDVPGTLLNIVGD